MPKIIFILSIIFSLCDAYSNDNPKASKDRLVDINTNICYHIYDPYEKFNRTMFTFNETLDNTILKPAVSAYNKTVPSWGRTRIRSFFINLMSPLTFLNNLLQGNPDAAAKTFFRFMINSTFGILGTIDYAKDFELYQNPQHFGDTFAHYGANYGAYLVLPFVGPSTVRSTVGMPFDAVLNPISLELNKEEMITAYLGNKFTARADILDFTSSLEASSLDYYAQVRSMYIQYVAKSNPKCQSATQVDYTIYNNYDDED